MQNWPSHPAASSKSDAKLASLLQRVEWRSNFDERTLERARAVFECSGTNTRQRSDESDLRELLATP